MSRPQKELTEQELVEIETMAGLGLSFEDIAAIKGVCDDTLKKHAQPFLRKGKAKAKAQVAQAAYRMAISGKVPSMTMFWLKTQAGWQEGNGASNTVEHNLSSLVEQINQSSKPSQILLAYLTEVLDQLRQGVLNPKVASSIASMSNILLKAAEQGQLEERLASLERVIKTQMPEPLDLEFELDAAPAPMNLNPSEKGHVSDRLKKLEANLTPKQFVLSYLEQVSACASLDERLKLLYSDEYKIWLEQGVENIASSAKQGIQDPRGQANAACQAIREGAYLQTLANWSYNAYEALRPNILYRIGCIGFSQVMVPITELRIWSEEEQNAYLRFKRMVESLWLELKSLQLAEAKISQKYLDGRPLLMRYQQEQLKEYFNLLETIFTLFEKMICALQQNSRSWRRKKGASQMNMFLKTAALDRSALLQAAEAHGETQLNEAKQQARIAVYELEDHHDEVRRIYKQMVYGDSSQPDKMDFEPGST